MKINLSQAGKRFNREWIFRKATLEFSPPNAYAITGPNGSGKSTLLQALGGMLLLSEGSISFMNEDKFIGTENAFQHISFCAPYLEVIEEMTFAELLEFHCHFKPFIPGFGIPEIIETVDLKNAAGKQVRYYSSGMKQRVKLAQAVFSRTPVVLLDEPCSNLDANGIELYHSLIKNYCANRLVIVSSNDEVEYSFCNIKIAVTDFKSTSLAEAFL
jgi:ABC-type multidrug transport system ATPase subunit